MGDLTRVASPENGTSMVVIYGRFASTLSFFTILTNTSGLGTFTISVGSIQSWTMQPKTARCGKRDAERLGASNSPHLKGS